MAPKCRKVGRKLILTQASASATRACVGDVRRLGRGARNAVFPQVEAFLGMWEPFVCQVGHVVLARLVEEFLDLLLAHGEAPQAVFHALHGQCEQHQKHWEEDHSETLHTGE